ncbi:hypothetical protein CSPX01_10419, partial [Colletotrichum filicis]
DFLGQLHFYPEVRCSNPGPGGPFFSVFSRYIISIFGSTLRF